MELKTISLSGKPNSKSCCFYIQSALELIVSASDNPEKLVQAYSYLHSAMINNEVALGRGLHCVEQNLFYNFLKVIRLASKTEDVLTSQTFKSELHYFLLSLYAVIDAGDGSLITGADSTGLGHAERDSGEDPVCVRIQEELNYFLENNERLPANFTTISLYELYKAIVEDFLRYESPQ